MDTNESDRDVVVACKGRVVDFFCTGNGNPVPNVTVMHVKSGESSSLPQLVGGGSATAMFTVTNASRVDNGTYVCRAENKVGVVNVSITLIVCESPPSISFYVSPKPSSSSQCLPVDGGFSLKCLAHGCPNPSIELIPPASTGIVARNGEAVYKITNGSPNGAYVCRVANVCGNVSKVHQLCTTDTGTPDIWVIVISTVAACLFAVLLAVILSPVAKRLHHSSRRVRIAANQDSGTLPPQMPD
ncbi:roundabout homolog 2-like isoform X2 [Oscarella lobularis]|uniref:roundabout homolog 2-like isoform X2 n=1 Tax=Oscarella lobularis TaxID=121494 RepID=UPI003313E1CA